MFRIFYGRENIDKAKFIFENADRKALVLVPDQFTLEAEKEALRCLETDGIMELEILSISRLGFRLLSETGGVKKRRIDKYGRHILLTSVISELAGRGELAVYGALAGKKSFTELVNNFIADLKQHEIKPQELLEMREAFSDREMLVRKLADLEKIYTRYEEKLAGNFIDTEDYIDLYLPAVLKSKFLRGREIWIWGFDYFAPKNVEFIAALMQVCEVNLVVTASDEARDRELFALTRNMMRRFEKKAKEYGIPCRIAEISAEEITGSGAARREKSAGFVLEQELFALPLYPEPQDSTAAQQVTLTAAANCYSEAEAAAAYVTRLVRDCGLRYRDILLVCNDLSARGTVIKRVFAEYGLNIFTDEKKGILSNPAVIYLLSVFHIVAKDYRTADVLGLLKTGFAPIERKGVEELENYAVKYKIRGGLWKQPFRYGRSEYTEEEFSELERLREELADFLGEFEKDFKASRKASDRISALYRFLSGRAALPEKIEIKAAEKEALGLSEAAQELSQVWEAIVAIFDQIINVIGEEKPSAETLFELLLAGFEAIEVGLLPPASDGLVLGTMQRTRTGRVKALIVLGASDGLLPLETFSEGLISEEEKKSLAEHAFEVSELDELRMQEERLAIYRTLSRPEQYFYMSYAASDLDGSEQKPSYIFNTVRRIFPSVEVTGDLEALSEREPLALMESRDGALNHLIRVLRESGGFPQQEEADLFEGSRLYGEWQDLLDWYKKNAPKKLQKAAAGLTYKNQTARLSAELTDRLYRRSPHTELTLSPSRLERYSRCPFAHFIAYGLRPKERRIFEAGMREIGDVYHECLMRFSQELSKETPAEKQDAGSRQKNLWHTITREESDLLVSVLMEKETAGYKEGLFISGSEEAYRREHMKEVLKEAAWMLVLQSRAGRIEKMYFEEMFGHAAENRFPPIELETAQGKICVEGKIDRVDILENGAVKVIDYKSGHEKFQIDEAQGGWRLQLMLYLKAAVREKEKETERKPAGVFYFTIQDADISCDGASQEEISEKLAESIKKQFRMNGIVIDSADNVDNIAGEFSRYSDIIEGLQRIKVKDENLDSKSAETGSTDDAEKERREGAAEARAFDYKGCVMSEAEFSALSDAFDAKITELAEALVSGEITARPKRVQEETACRYCQYKSICKFEISIPGCRYEKIV